MTANLHSKKIELGLLALLFKAPFHIKIINMDLSVFAFDQHRLLASLVKEYVEKFKSVPTKETLINFSNAKLTTEDSMVKIPESLLLLDSLPDIKPEEAAYYFSKAENYRVGRLIYDAHERLVTEFEKPEVDFIELNKNVVKDFLLMGTNEEGIKRGFIYENVKERFEEYTQKEKGLDTDVIPFGMKELDAIVGGMKKTTLSLVYAKTGGGKSRFGMNVVINVAKTGRTVMYVSLEMERNLLSSCIDSHLAQIDSHKIIFGQLDKADKIKYAKTLHSQMDSRLPIWVSDIPQGCTTSIVASELEIFKTVCGTLPDLVVVDYANILEPNKKHRDRSEKYDHIFKELKELARFYNVAVLTMMQESRDASMNDLKKKKGKEKEEIEGVHNIGLSNAPPFHCETVLRLKQSKSDLIANRLNVIINKNRLGTSSNKKIRLFCDWKINYVGDSEIPLSQGKLLKEG